MENKRLENITSESDTFTDLVKTAKLGDKKSMEEILMLFNDEIEYLSQFIMLPHEETCQTLQVELISIIMNQL